MADFGLCPDDRFELNESPADRLGIKKQQERKQIPALAASVLFGVIPRFGINTVIVLQFPSAADEAFALMGADPAMMMTDNTRSKRFLILFPIIVSEV